MTNHLQVAAVLSEPVLERICFRCGLTVVFPGRYAALAERVRRGVVGVETIAESAPGDAYYSFTGTSSSSLGGLAADTFYLKPSWSAGRLGSRVLLVH